MISVAYPRGLMNSEWEDDFLAFFKSRNISVKMSSESSYHLFLKGKKKILDEFCLPIKLFAGHVAELVEETDDPIFIPFISGNMQRTSFLCPLEIRLCDILINSGILPAERILSPSFIFNDDLNLLFKESHPARNLFGIPFYTFSEERNSTKIPIDNESKNNKTNLNLPQILVLGRSYVLKDNLMTGLINSSLEKLPVKRIDIFDNNLFSNQNREDKLSLHDFSHFALTGKIFRNLKEIINCTNIDGIIVLKPFLCGPDCGLEKDILRFIPKEKVPPILETVIDEQLSGEGIQTRLEAFIDLVTLNRNNRLNISYREKEPVY